MKSDAPRDLPRLLIITGLMAAGKSTVAQALAQRLPRSVHLRGDVFRKMIVNGGAEMSAEPTAEALAQLVARHEHACDMARTYVGLGFTVILQDVILGPYLEHVLERVRDLKPGVVVLVPSTDVLAERDKDRAKTGYGAQWTPEALAPALDDLPKVGLWLDTTTMTIEETVNSILREAHVSRSGLD